MGVYSIPKPITDKLEELNKFVTENPDWLSVPQTAEFLGMNAAGLRNSIEKGLCPFGIAWQKDVRGNKAFKIPTVTFYIWYTQGVSLRS